MAYLTINNRPLYVSDMWQIMGEHYQETGEYVEEMYIQFIDVETLEIYDDTLNIPEELARVMDYDVIDGVMYVYVSSEDNDPDPDAYINY